MILKTLIENTSPLKVEGSLDKEITLLTMDSRKVNPGALFAALKGTQVDGHQFIKMAIEKGASAILCEELPEVLQPAVTYIQAHNSAAALGEMADTFYGRPSSQLKLVGVTGTNGKTTTVTLLHDLFSKLGYKAGLISTIEIRVGARVVPATHTTPDAISLHATIADMLLAGCDYVFMEVSSHAVDQQRIAGLSFAGALFSNITHDHLDYHKTFKAYINAKKAFFDQLPKTAFALTNIDDRRGNVMVQNTKAKIYRYSLLQMADFRAKIIENSLTGLHLEIDNQELFSRLIGDFNAYNLLAAYATARLLDQDQLEVLTSLSSLKAAEGRFDYVQDPSGKRTGLVDYAHTPDALEKVLSTLNKLRQGTTRIITVVGAGGDRDKAKRPKMAKVACDYSDQVVLTSDNPRSEEPEAIIRDMEEGIPAYAGQKVLVITDRRQAIKTACRLAQAGDIVLVAGKGHEKYQEIKGVKHPFDDKEILNEEFLANNV